MSSPVTTIARAAEALARVFGLAPATSADERARRSLALLLLLELLERPEFGVDVEGRARALDILEAMTAQGDVIADQLLDAFAGPLPGFTPSTSSPASSPVDSIPPPRPPASAAPATTSTVQNGRVVLGSVTSDEAVRVANQAMGKA